MINQQALDQLTKARMNLMFQDPFFASLVLGFRFKEKSSLKGATTDGRTVFYNPEYILSLPKDQVTSLLICLIMHTVNFHTTRRLGRNIGRWNKACDYAIHPYVKDAKYELPASALYNEKFRNMSAEAIYNYLVDEADEQQQKKQKGKPQKGDGSGQPQKGQGGQGEPSDEEGEDDGSGFGDIEDASPVDENGDSVTMEEIEHEISQQLIQATESAKAAGKMSADMQGMVDKVLNPVMPWQQILAQFVTANAKDDYCFSKPNQRYTHMGLALPSLWNEKLEDMYIFVDTSGSINETELAAFVAEVRSITSTFNQSVTLLYIDTKVQGIQTLEPDDNSPLKVAGFGGTDFKPGFEYLIKKDIQPVAVIYFTDMECNSFPETPAYPVLWAKTGNGGTKPPFGEVINLTFDRK